MKKEMSEMAHWQEEFPYNLSLFIPLGDQIVDWKAAFAFFEKTRMKTGKVKNLATFTSFKHELFNEVERARPFTALEEWIRKTSKV